MLRPARLVLAAVIALVATIPAGAQSAAPPARPQPSTSPHMQVPAGEPSASGTSATAETRPATTTVFGDTGLWFVPTAEILPNGKWSASGYRAGFNHQEGFSNIAYLLGTFGVGIRDRVELFGSFRFDTRIDRDVRPLFVTPQPDAGGLVNNYPYVRDQWSSGVGDLFAGAKFSILSESRQQPVALAVRGMVKLPTGDRDKGLSTGKPDLLLDAIVSKEIPRAVELSASGGFTLRTEPDAPVTVGVANSFRWGVGAGFPSRSALRIFTELHGERFFDDVVAASGTIRATDGSLSPLLDPIRNRATATLGFTWQARSGFFAGAGINYDFLGSPRGDFPVAGEGLHKSRLRDYADFQVRIGYHPGTRVYAPPPPPPPPPPPAPPSNRPPTVKAQCEPCTVEVGKSATVRADAQDPDGDTLQYRWSAPSGTFANTAERQSVWTAPTVEGPVPVTVTVDDGKGGTATDNVTIQVVRPAQKTYTFEDVHFDFDRYSLRADATRVLDEVLTAFKEDPNLRIEVEGHTCNIGTAEYNLALGERRSNSVRDYLISRGIPAERVRSVSYGEERPKYDNAREETRRMNRRAALVVRLQQQ